ncbi:MAG: transporter substrate-binding domain-containing protein [Deltaproteobacteria bacterium]|nr:transporter substrate-binding domain-containing protein [Deltaproteobacteria bacterium]
MPISRSIIAFSLFMTSLVVGFGTVGPALSLAGNPAQEKMHPLRVGITPNYPPIIFKLKEKITGVEADLARLLGERLHRPVEFIPLRWERQIPALMEGQTDIIMSGMSITIARKIRIDFTKPYLQGGLLAAFRTENASKYNSYEKIVRSRSVVGVVESTTGHVFVQKNFENAQRIIALAKSSDGAFELKRRGIDLFVYDAPSIIWLVSENEAELTAHWDPLNEEFLAWGLRREDQALLKRINEILDIWKEDGTLAQVLKRWLPYMKLP